MEQDQPVTVIAGETAATAVYRYSMEHDQPVTVIAGETAATAAAADVIPAAAATVMVTTAGGSSTGARDPPDALALLTQSKDIADKYVTSVRFRRNIGLAGELAINLPFAVGLIQKAPAQCFPGGSTRRYSLLLDILTAVCMHLAVSFDGMQEAAASSTESPGTSAMSQARQPYQYHGNDVPNGQAHRHTSRRYDGPLRPLSDDHGYEHSEEEDDEEDEEETEDRPSTRRRFSETVGDSKYEQLRIVNALLASLSLLLPGALRLPSGGFQTVLRANLPLRGFQTVLRANLPLRSLRFLLWLLTEEALGPSAHSTFSSPPAAPLSHNPHPVLSSSPSSSSSPPPPAATQPTPPPSPPSPLFFTFASCPYLYELAAFFPWALPALPPSAQPSSASPFTAQLSSFASFTFDSLAGQLQDTTSNAAAAAALNGTELSYAAGVKLTGQTVITQLFGLLLQFCHSPVLARSLLYDGDGHSALERPGLPGTHRQRDRTAMSRAGSGFKALWGILPYLNPDRIQAFRRLLAVALGRPGPAAANDVAGRPSEPETVTGMGGTSHWALEAHTDPAEEDDSSSSTAAHPGRVWMSATSSRESEPDRPGTPSARDVSEDVMKYMHDTYMLPIILQGLQAETSRGLALLAQNNASVLSADILATECIRRERAAWLVGFVAWILRASFSFNCQEAVAMVEKFNQPMRVGGYKILMEALLWIFSPIPLPLTLTPSPVPQQQQQQQQQHAPSSPIASAVASSSPSPSPSPSPASPSPASSSPSSSSPSSSAPAPAFSVPNSWPVPSHVAGALLFDLSQLVAFGLPEYNDPQLDGPAILPFRYVGPKETDEPAEHNHGTMGQPVPFPVQPVPYSPPWAEGKSNSRDVQGPAETDRAARQSTPPGRKHITAHQDKLQEAGWVVFRDLNHVHTNTEGHVEAVARQPKQDGSNIEQQAYAAHGTSIIDQQAYPRQASSSEQQDTRSGEGNGPGRTRGKGGVEGGGKNDTSTTGTRMSTIGTPPDTVCALVSCYTVRPRYFNPRAYRVLVYLFLSSSHFTTHAVAYTTPTSTAAADGVENIEDNNNNTGNVNNRASNDHVGSADPAGNNHVLQMQVKHVLQMDRAVHLRLQNALLAQLQSLHRAGVVYFPLLSGNNEAPGVAGGGSTASSAVGAFEPVGVLEPAASFVLPSYSPSQDQSLLRGRKATPGQAVAPFAYPSPSPPSTSKPYSTSRSPPPASSPEATSPLASPSSAFSFSSSRRARSRDAASQSTSPPRFVSATTTFSQLRGECTEHPIDLFSYVFGDTELPLSPALAVRFACLDTQIQQDCLRLLRCHLFDYIKHLLSAGPGSKHGIRSRLGHFLERLSPVKRRGSSNANLASVPGRTGAASMLPSKTASGTLWPPQLQQLGGTPPLSPGGVLRAVGLPLPSRPAAAGLPSPPLQIAVGPSLSSQLPLPSLPNPNALASQLSAAQPPLSGLRALSRYLQLASYGPDSQFWPSESQSSCQSKQHVVGLSACLFSWLLHLLAMGLLVPYEKAKAKASSRHHHKNFLRDFSPERVPGYRRQAVFRKMHRKACSVFFRYAREGGESSSKRADKALWRFRLKQILLRQAEVSPI
eukprot:g52003.t1